MEPDECALVIEAREAAERERWEHTAWWLSHVLAAQGVKRKRKPHELLGKEFAKAQKKRRARLAKLNPYVPPPDERPATTEDTED